MTKARREYWRAQAAFCKFYGVSPADVRAMPAAQYHEWAKYREEYVRAQHKK